MSFEPTFYMLIRIIQQRGGINDVYVNEDLILGVKYFRKWKGMGYRQQVEGLTFGKGRNTLSL